MPISLLEDVRPKNGIANTAARRNVEILRFISETPLVPACVFRVEHQQVSARS
jgi:hypothetical protein